MRYNKQGNDTAMLLDDIDLDNNISSIAAEDHRDVIIIIIIPSLLHWEKLWKPRGSVEAITTASFFLAPGTAESVGLSPIVGAFAVGMAVASTTIIKQIYQDVDKLQIIFGHYSLQSLEHKLI
jgi:Kef-type K+ transport system membrane component KefB